MPLSNAGLKRVTLLSEPGDQVVNTWLSGAPAGWVNLPTRGESFLLWSAGSEIIEVIVVLDHDALIRQLRLEVGRVGRAVADLERAHERSPARAVGVNGPDAPQMMAAEALRFERAEHDSAILEDDRVQGH